MDEKLPDEAVRVVALIAAAILQTNNPVYRTATDCIDVAVKFEDFIRNGQKRF